MNRRSLDRIREADDEGYLWGQYALFAALAYLC